MSLQMPFEFLQIPENAAAIWSAVAATFSALAAFLSWQAQVKTLKHSFRPELVLSGWQRTQHLDAGQELISFNSIKNTGRDTARQVVINSFAIAGDGSTTYFMPTQNIASLAPNEDVGVNGRITVNWNSVPSDSSGAKYR